MNAYTQTEKMIIETLRDVSASARSIPVVEDPKAALARVIERHNNGSTLQVERALAAIHAGRAAFWNMSDYSDASGTILLDGLNGGMLFDAALERAYRYKPDDVKKEALDRLIPLNRLAANDLSEAYDQFATWRDARELERRAR